MKCYWVDENQTIEDFMFRLTPNQPIGFSAAYGGDILGLGGDITVPPFGAGEWSEHWRAEMLGGRCRGRPADRL